MGKGAKKGVEKLGGLRSDELLGEEVGAGKGGGRQGVEGGVEVVITGGEPSLVRRPLGLKEGVGD